MARSKSYFSLPQPLSLVHFLFVQRVQGFTPPGRPGLDDQSADRFLEELKFCRNYLEFGSGGTTLVADRLRIPTVSVESDRFFAKAVRQGLRSDTNVEILDIYLGITREWSEPIFKRPTPARLERWRKYISSPLLQLSQRSVIPDFVLVDGRFRRSCILELAQVALKAGQTVRVMVDDYYENGREHYHKVEDVIGIPEKVGRAALFQISRDRSPKIPSHTELDEAAADYR